MRCKWRRWLWGLLPVLLLSVIATAVEHERLESDLGRRASLALSQAGLGWADAAFQGRDGVLSGLASQEDEPQKAAEVLAGVWGVRRVDNRTGLAEKAERYQWWASRRNLRVRLGGYVPSGGARQAILGVTRATFPGSEVVDRMTLARGVPALDDWLAGVSFALKQLAALRHGDVRLDGLTLAITGEAEDAAAYRATHTALRSALPKGISLFKDEVSPPVATPYTWAARSLDGELLLKGHVPGEADRAALLAAAKESVPSARLQDEMEAAAGAPEGWAAAAIASVRALPGLKAGSAELNDAVLVVTGTASDAATAKAIRARLRAALPASITLREQIATAELPPPASRPAPAASDGPPTSSAPRAEVTPPDGAAGKAPLPAAAAEATAPAAVASAPSESAQLPRVLSNGDPRTQGCRDALADAAESGVILFRLGSAELDATSFATLNRLAKAAQSCPDMLIEVAGHASADGKEAVNQRLSLRRAQSVVGYLVRVGVDRQQLESAGFGATRPIAPNDSIEHMAKNRRIEFTVRPK